MHGVALRRNGQNKAAEPLLRQILIEAESLVLAHHELGLALKGQGRLSEAIISLETAVRLQPNLRTAWRDLYELRPQKVTTSLLLMPIVDPWAASRASIHSDSGA